MFCSSTCLTPLFVNKNVFQGVLNIYVLFCCSILSSKELRSHVEHEIHQLGKVRPGTNLTQFFNEIIKENVEVIQISDIDSENDLHQNLVILLFNFSAVGC